MKTNFSLIPATVSLALPHVCRPTSNTMRDKRTIGASHISSDFNYTYPNDMIWDKAIAEMGVYPVDYTIG